MISKDLLVIGAGPGGLVAAMRGARRGLDVLMAEKGDIGGVCLNRGCIPSKSLKKASDIAYYPKEGSDLGIDAEVNVDYSKTISWTRKNVKKLVGGMKKRLKKAGVQIEGSEASFLDSQRADVGGEEVEFENCIVATGSTPNQLPSCPFDPEKILSSDEFFELNELPEEFLIVGAGYIGMEIGTISAKLGSEVAVVEALDQILPLFDEGTVKPVRKKARKIGIDINLNQKVSGVETEGEGISVLTEDGGEYSGDKCLVVCGRAPNTEGLGLDNTDLNQTEKGFVDTDDQYRTDDPNIYAVGDVVGGKMLAHEAYNEASIAVDSILGEKKEKAFIPEVVFTDPQIARIGEFNGEYDVGEASLREVSAAYTKNKTDGRIRIWVDGDGTVKGGEIVAPMASEIIHQIGQAVQNERNVENIVDTVHAHPTISEGVLLAAEDALGSPSSAL